MYARVGVILIEDDGGVAYGSQKRDRLDRLDRQPTSSLAAAQISRPRRAAGKSELRKEPPKATRLRPGRCRSAVGSQRKLVTAVGGE